MPRILVFSGSSRATSLNLRLARLAASRLATLGAEVEEISLADFPLPFVDEDGRASVPDMARHLNDIIQSHHGLFIACPEYNSGYPPVLKNALDWVSMAKTGGPALAGKVVGLGAASPGARGGYRALTQFRSVLELGFGALVIPEMASVPFADKALSETNTLTDVSASKFLDATLARLVKEAGHVAQG
jgi:chromate reductase, NAD(P)H dehydrogenase (quinone)